MMASEYLQQLVALLPSGPAIPREPGSRLSRLLEAPAAELARIEGRAVALLDEADPRLTAEMLTDWERAFGLPNPCAPYESFSRASTATYFDGAGVLQVAAVDQPRPVFDPITGAPTGTIIIEQASANEIRNPRARGAVVGSPGTLPTLWTYNPDAGLAREVVATGTLDGRPYVDVRIYGTPTLSVTRAVTLETNAAVPTALGEPWAGSVYLAIVGGSKVGLNNIHLYLRGTDGGLVVETIRTSIFSLIDGSLRRFVLSGAFSNPATTHARIDVAFSITSGVPIDFILRIFGPQLERGTVATSLILPPPGTNARSTRAADILRITGLPQRRDALLGRITGVGGQSRAYFTAVAAALGYAISIAEPRPFRCGLSTCGQGLRDSDWAHTWIVYSAGEAEQLFRIGLSAMGEPLRSWGEALLECVIGALAPAHTRVLFAYGPELLLLTDEFEALGTNGGEMVTP